MAEEIIGLLSTCWRSIHEFGESLTPTEWDAATECPGWTVRDNVSHLIAIERKLLGLPDDPALGEYPAHVKNDLGRFNEGAIELRRGRSGAEVLAEFADVTAKRERMLLDMSTEQFDAPTWSPMGDMPYRQFMSMRLFDSWAHEQDMRRAVGRPDHLTGPVVEAVMAWHLRSLGFIVGKRAGAPDGAIVEFAVTGPTAANYFIAVRDRRATVVDRPSAAPTATLTCDTETFNALLCGRCVPDDALADGTLTLAGDLAIAQAVARAMPYVI